MLRAQKRDAVLTEKFYFRRTLTTCDSPPEAQKMCCGGGQAPKASDDYIEMTVNEIINGKPPDFPGLIALIHQFLDSAEVDVDTRCTIEQYLRFIQRRASGTIWTLAHWMRQFVTRHPSYKKDSVVTDEINYDLVKTMDDIAQGRAHCPCLLGNFRTKSNVAIPSAFEIAENMYRNYVARQQSVNGVDNHTIS
jgi:glutamate--cysteine ligase catalytic subunit